VGVCTFGIPGQAKVFDALVPGHAALELSRLVLLDEVPGDGESWFVARAMAIAREECRITAIVSYSDPVPRTTIKGEPVCPGHVGVVYQALGAEYKGSAARAPTTSTPMAARSQAARCLRSEISRRAR
jgi:hypothetical protein